MGSYPDDPEDQAAMVMRDEILALRAENARLREALTEVYNTVALHAHAIQAEVRLIHDAALKASRVTLAEKAPERLGEL